MPSTCSARCDRPSLALPPPSARHARRLRPAPTGHARNALRHMVWRAARERRQPAACAASRVRHVHAAGAGVTRSRRGGALHRTARRHDRPRAEERRRPRPREPRQGLLHLQAAGRLLRHRARLARLLRRLLVDSHRRQLSPPTHRLGRHVGRQVRVHLTRARRGVRLARAALLVGRRANRVPGGRVHNASIPRGDRPLCGLPLVNPVPLLPPHDARLHNSHGRHWA
mmetsp:Transcript_35077/g.61465  ORF Transcript_35077/g.61465 Transcript_35077/m.61465 type:complete len:227 (-) Transcript_35077:54-734(-)